MSKLSFRARALDASKPMPIFLAEDLPDLPDYSAINRAVPQMPSGMEKEEECEHHLQRAICTGLIIPTPEVCPVADLPFYERCYPPDYKMPKQHIHMQPLWQEQEAPEYDMDSEDERWLRQQRHPELTELKFEQMMDKLERSSGQTVVTLGEAKLLLERQDDLVIAVYDYWLNKRLKTQHPLVLAVRTEGRLGQSTSNPYLAFRRRTEKMQTRKNRKNDESSYEKMLKLRRDLARAATLLELVARRETAKRDLLRLTALLAERRFQANDFAGQLIAEIAQAQPQYAAVALGTPTAASYRREAFTVPHYTPRAPSTPPDLPRQREKRPYKRRKHRHHGSGAAQALRDLGAYTSSEEEGAAAGGGAVGGAGGGARASEAATAAAASTPDDGPFAFTRKPGCFYELPTSTLYGDPVEYDSSLCEHEMDNRHRYTLTSISEPYPKCVGFARRRMGRGGRLLLDRMSTPLDDLWPRLRFSFAKSTRRRAEQNEEADLETKPHRDPMELTRDYHTSGKYPWRHAFRRHLARNSHLWLVEEDGKDSLVRTKKEPAEEEPPLGSSDISVSDERTALDASAKRALVEHARKRPLSVCSESESSCDSEGGLLPVERKFEEFFQEVNAKWLHFRPKTPPPSPLRPSPSLDELVPLNEDATFAVDLYSPTEKDPFTTDEMTLRGLQPEPPSDGSGDDTALTHAQLEAILTETVEHGKEHFLSRGQSAASGRAASGLAHAPAASRTPRASLGSSVVSVTRRPPVETALLVDAPEPAPPPPPASVAPVVASAPAAAPAAKPSASTAKATVTSAPRTPASSAAPAPVPAAKIIVEEVNDVGHAWPEQRRGARHARDEAPPPPEEVQPAQGAGVQVKTVHHKHSPLKKHIVTSAPHRTASSSATDAAQQQQQAPQMVTVAVSESLKVRLQNHLLSAQQGVVGLVQNGPFSVSAALALPTPSAAHGVSAGLTAVSTSSPRRVSAGAPVVHLAAGALQQKPLQLAPPPVVVGSPHALHHVPPNKLKVVHANTLTHTQRAQLLAQSRAAAATGGTLTHLPAVVSLATFADGKQGPGAAVQLKAAPGSVPQFFEIKGGQLAKGHQLVNVVRQPHPAKATIARFDINDPKKRGHVLATFDGTLKGNLTANARPHRLSVSLDGRQLVRAALPGVRAPHLRHQIQLKNRTLQVARAPPGDHAAAAGAAGAGAGVVASASGAPPPPGSITIAAASKASVVANLLHKNVALKTQKIAISSAGVGVGVAGQPLAANVQAIAFTAQQLKARQARLIAQPRTHAQPEIVEASTAPSTSSTSSLAADGELQSVGVVGGDTDASTNGAVRRRPTDTLPMEVT